MKNIIMLNTTSKKEFFLALLILTITLPMPSIAADKKDKSAHRMQQMVQKIQQEKAELQTQVDHEKEARAGIEAEVKKSAGETNSLKSNLRACKKICVNDILPMTYKGNYHGHTQQVCKRPTAITSRAS